MILPIDGRSVATGLVFLAIATAIVLLGGFLIQEKVRALARKSSEARRMRANPDRAKRFFTLGVISVGIAAAALSPSIRDAWESSQQATESARGPDYQKGMHDSGVYWGLFPQTLQRRLPSSVGRAHPVSKSRIRTDDRPLLASPMVAVFYGSRICDKSRRRGCGDAVERSRAEVGKHSVG
jgi:hypothetical protein